MTQQLTQYSAFAMEPGSQLSILDPNTRGAKRHSCTLSQQQDSQSENIKPRAAFSQYSHEPESSLSLSQAYSFSSQVSARQRAEAALVQENLTLKNSLREACDENQKLRRQLRKMAAALKSKNIEIAQLQDAVLELSDKFEDVLPKSHEIVAQKDQDDDF